MTDAHTKMLQQMMESGQEMLRSFSSGFTAQKSPFTTDNLGESFFPTMPAEVMEMWFGKTFNREGLDAKTRLFVTLAALIMVSAHPVSEKISPVDSQIRLTIKHALEAGASIQEISEVIWQMSVFSGLPVMQKVLELAQAVCDESAATKGAKK